MAKYGVKANVLKERKGYENERPSTMAHEA